MGLDLFRAAPGIDIQNDDFSSNAYILQGVGVPGGDGGRQDDAPIGSFFMRTDVAPDNLQLYYKYKDDKTTTDWFNVPSKSYVDTAIDEIDASEISITSSIACFSPQPANVQEALDQLCTTITEINAGDIIITESLPCFFSPQPTNLQEVLDQLCTSITEINAGDILITESSSCFFSPQPANVQEALDQLCTSITEINAGDIIITESIACFSPQPATLQEILDQLCTNVADLELNDLTDVESTGEADRDTIVFNGSTNQWENQAIEDYQPRPQFAHLLVLPSETVHPTEVFTNDELETLPFYTYKTGYGAGSPGYWGNWRFLYENVWHDYRARGNAFSLNGDGRIECHYYGDIKVSLYVSISCSANNTSVALAICRERVYEEYFPLVSATENPNINKPRGITMVAILPVWAGDRIGLGICTDHAGTLTFYDGSFICEMMFTWE